jgi:hypothetical protein
MTPRDRFTLACLRAGRDVAREASRCFPRARFLADAIAARLAAEILRREWRWPDDLGPRVVAPPRPTRPRSN